MARRRCHHDGFYSICICIWAPLFFTWEPSLSQSSTPCSKCIHQNSWTQLLRFLLLLTTSHRDLQHFPEVDATRHDALANAVSSNLVCWVNFVNFMNERLDCTLYDNFSIAELLKIWRKAVEFGSIDKVLRVLWALLKRRENCPYKICSKIYCDFERLVTQHLLAIKTA